ncbi:iron complex transport system substrate-binding protein [Pseudonocardia endophytica]|uniref:Iron complex transport system substrate-binding protein n=1 Tax=Pseudonocardia endophytica TaxID=401976 RepID=A0A4R1HQD4_PSEEN|nr:iron complex transport system substrate-binding protein [Pseudonocardia endophytica]
MAGAVLAACGRTETGPAPASDGVFPVTVEGIEGPTTVDAEPQRVVTVGTYRDIDAALALGVVPVAAAELPPMIPGGITPWAKERIGGSPMPELFATTGGMPFEKIASLAPDLIIGTDYSGLANDYGTLSGIAPTLSSASGYNKDTWQVTTNRVGQALGRARAAADTVARIEAAIRAAREQNPGFAGRTFTIGPVTPDGTVYTINSTNDASARFLSDLGLTLSPSVLGLAGDRLPGRAVVSPELLRTLDADVMILSYSNAASRQKVEAEPLFQQIPAVRRGAYVPVETTTAVSIAFPSALSIPYGLQKTIPLIAAALTR